MIARLQTYIHTYLHTRLMRMRAPSSTRVAAILRRVLVVCLILVSALVVLRLAPKAPLSDLTTYSSAVYASDGALLRLTTARDEQFRLWTSIDEISPKLIEAVKRYEDRWYDWHPGVNPAAIVRSARETFFGERRMGGSTITMQLARKVYDIDSRNVPGKLKQIAAALWLEARYSKRDIMEAYLNFAPYGGNIEGVGAASLVYFHKRAADLTLPEAFTLAVILQNPAARGASQVNAKATQDARARLAAIWLAAHPEDERLGAAHAIAAKSASSLPFRAPHLANQLLQNRALMLVEGESSSMASTSTKGREVFSTIDARMQTTLERSIAQMIDRRNATGIRNAAAMLVDTRSMEVRALIGSANFHDDDIDGQVNGVLAKRSPGSTLKPFIYALAFDQGVLHPMTVVKDAPSAFGPFSPENFDGRFVGPITAQDALTRSRNVPAVAIASKLTRPNLYDVLQQSGVTNLQSEKHYGLALTLGGGEVTMEELARLYATLANGGELRALQYTKSAKARPVRNDKAQATRLFSEEAAFVTLDMLNTNPRPDTGQPARPSVAWKTGTSWGFRDAWTAGVFGDYVLVVWVGNFDGASNPALVGVSAAAPLFFNMVDALRQEGLVSTDVARLPPRKLTRVDVCAATGDLPNVYCAHRIPTWYVPGRSPIRLSNLHRNVLIDKRTGEAVCNENEHTTWEVREYWSSDMQKIFRDAGMPRRAAPHVPDCGAGFVQAGNVAPMVSSTLVGSNQMNSQAVQIVSPLRAVTYSMRISKPTPFMLRAEGERGKLYWFANDAFVGESQAGENLAWSPPRAGRFVIRVVNEDGIADSRDMTVEVIP